MTDKQILDRVAQIETQIKTCQSNALRFYDDSAEVSEQYDRIDELLAEKARLLKEYNKSV